MENQNETDNLQSSPDQRQPNEVGHLKREWNAIITLYEAKKFQAHISPNESVDDFEQQCHEKARDIDDKRTNGYAVLLEFERVDKVERSVDLRQVHYQPRAHVDQGNLWEGKSTGKLHWDFHHSR